MIKAKLMAGAVIVAALLSGIMVGVSYATATYGNPVVTSVKSLRIERVVRERTFTTEQSGGASALCDTGGTAIGGGGYVSSGVGEITQTFPLTENGIDGWLVNFVSTSTGSKTVVAVATCLY